MQVPFHVHPEFNDVFRCRNCPLVDVNTAIHSDDEMLSYIEQQGGGDREAALWEYFTGGIHMLNLVRDIAQKKHRSLSNVHSFLDFASGYGRLTRFLVKELGRECIWISDIYSNAVEFQRQQFRVRGLVSVPYPKDFRCEERFDFIFVASLFSHLPEKLSRQWLSTLYNLLAPQGVLVFSVHGDTLLPPQMTMPPTGFLFQAHSESLSLNKEEYGSAWVTEDFMRKVIREGTGQDVYALSRRGLWNLQDVYAIAKDGQLDSGENISWGPDGRVEECRIIGSSELLLSGWAADLSRGGGIGEVQIWVDGKRVARTTPRFSRPDVALAFRDQRIENAGWRVVLHAPPANAKIVINAVNNLGAENFLRPARAGLMNIS